MNRVHQAGLPVATLAGVVALASAATAQGFITTEGDIIAAQSDPAPGIPGAFFDGLGAFQNPVVDSDGKVMFSTRLVGAVTDFDDRAHWEATTKSDLSLIIREGDQAPGLAAGITLNSATSSHGLITSYRRSADGRTLWSSRLDDGGATVTSANDSAIFGGFSGSLGVIAREGDPAPGTIGATFSSSLLPSTQMSGINESGRVLFKSDLAGGDVIGSSNDEAWFTGTDGAIEILQRKGDTIPLTSPPGGDAVVGALGFIGQMNGSGQVLHESTLSQTPSTTPPTTAANDKALFVYSPGFGDSLRVREGDPAPGTTNATFGRPSATWSPSVGVSAFNALAQFVLNSDLAGGDTVIDVNDKGMWISGLGGAGLDLVIRRGDPAPGIPGALWNAGHGSHTSLNVHGQIATQGSLIQGGAVDDTNDSGIWISTPYDFGTGTPGTLQLIVREGDPVPGMPGLVFEGLISYSTFYFNNKGQLVFRANLVDPIAGPPDAGSLWTYDPVDGLRLAIMDGDQFEISPGVFKEVTGWGGVQFNNGDGAALSFNHEGEIALRVSVFDGSAAIVKARIRSLVGVPPTISTATGGVQDLYLNAGPAHAGGTYLLVGSLSGTSPGIPVGPGQVFPLNPDSYLTHTLTNPNAPPLASSFSTLNADGRGTASFTLPTGWPGLAGSTAHHAFAVLSLAGVDFISVAEPLTFLP